MDIPSCNWKERLETQKVAHCEEVADLTKAPELCTCLHGLRRLFRKIAVMLTVTLLK